MGKGFGGMPGNVQGLMKQAQKMQEDLQKKQMELEGHEVETQSGGGSVKVKMNGRYEIEEILISPDVVNLEEKDLLQDLIKAAINNAVAQTREYAREEMQKVTGGMNIPGLF